jgi:hypothetical protein
VIALAARAATVILAAATLACLGVFVWSLYRAADVGTVVIRHVAPLMAAIAFAGSLRARSAVRVNIALSVSACAVALFVLEIGLSVVQRDLYEFKSALLLHFASARDVNTLEGRARVAAERGVKFDTRSRLQVMRDLERQGIRSYPSIFPTLLMTGDGRGPFLTSRLSIDGIPTLPLGGVSAVATILCNESGEYTIYDADEHGFNNPRGLWSRDRVAIAAVGDSFALGSCVPAGKSFVDLIRRQYPATVNLGMDNNGPLLEFAGLREFLPALRPRSILWFYYEGNDLENLWYEKSSPLLMRYLGRDFSQDLARRQAAIDKALAAYIEGVKSGARAPLWKQIATLFHIREAAGRLFRRRDTVPSSSPQSIVEQHLLRELLAEANRTAETWGGRVYFVYLPAWRRYAAPPTSDSERHTVLSLVRQLGIPIIDIHGPFERTGDPIALFPFRQDGHYNEAGHRLVADEVLGQLQSHGRRAAPAAAPGEPATVAAAGRGRRPPSRICCPRRSDDYRSATQPSQVARHESWAARPERRR